MGELEYHRDNLLLVDDIWCAASRSARSPLTDRRQFRAHTLPSLRHRRNFTKGERASTKEMEETFETTDQKQVARLICERGQLELTAEEREKLKLTSKDVGPVA